MGENKRLFQIGVLSKLTGVHIRCLRYYEELGILRPAHVDSITGYRYYTYRQMRIVEAIQYCVELDISLKKFAEFISEKNGNIDYAGLVAYGKQVTEEKLAKILARQRFVEKMQEDMAHAEECEEKGKTISNLAGDCYYCKPFNSVGDDVEYQSELVALIGELEAKGLKAGFSMGILMLVKDGKALPHMFIDVKNADMLTDDIRELIRIPSGRYMCIVNHESVIYDAQSIFADEIKAHPNTIITETELFKEQFPYEKPLYELRCYIGETL